MTGFIYAIGNADGLVKIGFSSDPERRFCKVRSDTASPCHLMGYVRGSRDDEASLHSILQSERVHGEWYRQGDGVKAFIKRLNPPAAKEKKYKVSFSLDAVGTRSEVAARINVDKSQLTRWAQRGIPAARVVDVERITGIPREQLRPDLYTREASQ
jgi:hypothetical protein